MEMRLFSKRAGSEGCQAWLVATPLQARLAVPGLSSLCASASSSSKTPVMGPQPSCFAPGGLTQLTTATKTLFPNKVTL